MEPYVVTPQVTPQITIKDTGTMKENHPRLSSLDMCEYEDGFKNFMPLPSNRTPKVLGQMDLDESYRSTTNSANHRRQGSAESYYSNTSQQYDDDEDYDDDGDSQYNDDEAQRREEQIDRVNLSGNLTARVLGYTPRSPKRVVRISPRSQKTFNNWKKYDGMYKEDRKNNVNPLFMSSMCEYDDPWTRECKQKRKSKQRYVGGKEWTVTPHHAAVAKRDHRAAQTSVTARGPYVPPHEAHRRFFFDRRKWLEGPWHIPAPSGSFTNRGTTFAAASALEKGQVKNSMRGNTVGRSRPNINRRESKVYTKSPRTRRR